MDVKTVGGNLMDAEEALSSFIEFDWVYTELFHKVLLLIISWRSQGRQMQENWLCDFDSMCYGE